MSRKSTESSQDRMLKRVGMHCQVQMVICDRSQINQSRKTTASVKERGKEGNEEREKESPLIVKEGPCRDRRQNRLNDGNKIES